ncbi:MAG: aconitate hydratase, partial [Actinomycetota bacterium]
VAPLPAPEARKVNLVKGPNIRSLPELDPLPDAMELPVLLKVRDNVSTDEIMPAGQRVLPYRSNIPAIAEFVFSQVDETYPARARAVLGGHCVVGGTNYGQGSSREHAAIAPRYLGLRVVIAKDYARIHWQNLPNFGVLPLTFADPSAYDAVDRGDVLAFEGLRAQLAAGPGIVATNLTGAAPLALTHDLSERQVEMVLGGGLINVFRNRLKAD